MNDDLGRRKAAFELRQRAADALDRASELDGLPAIRLMLTDLRKIAEAAGCDPEKLADAALALYPGQNEVSGVMSTLDEVAAPTAEANALIGVDDPERQLDYLERKGRTLGPALRG